MSVLLCDFVNLFAGTVCAQIAWESAGGLKAGLMTTFTSSIDQEYIDRIESPVWRRLLFAMCFLHSALQERRKFGPQAWSVPYEFSSGDLMVCCTSQHGVVCSGCVGIAFHDDMRVLIDGRLWLCSRLSHTWSANCLLGATRAATHRHPPSPGPPCAS